MASVDQKLDALNQKIDALFRALSGVPGLAAALGAGAAEEKGDDGSSHPSIIAYDEFHEAYVVPLAQTADKLSLEKIPTLLRDGFSQLRTILLAATQCAKPTPQAFQTFARPLIDVSDAASSLVNNRHPQFHHQNAFKEFILALGWVFISPTPMGHVQAAQESADFYLNKILTTNKEAPNKDDHRAFVRQIKENLEKLRAYIKAHHTTGLTWKPNGADLASYKPGKPAGAAPAPGPVVPGPGPALGAGGPPLGASVPPAMPPANLDMGAPPAPAAGPAGLGAVFAQLNQGHDALVSGLRKVTKDMKSKPESSVVVESGEKKRPEAPVAAAKAAPAALPPALYEKQGKWFVEHYTGGQVEIDAETLNVKQNIYIYKCKNTTVIVPSKCKAITVDACDKTNVIFPSVVSTLEVVNSKNIGVQVNEIAPSISIEKTSSCQLYLSRSAVEARPDIVTSNITALNVIVPGATEADDPIELAIPEQYTSRFTSNTSMSTEVVVHKNN